MSLNETESQIMNILVVNGLKKMNVTEKSIKVAAENTAINTDTYVKIHNLHDPLIISLRFSFKY